MSADRPFQLNRRKFLIGVGAATLSELLSAACGDLGSTEKVEPTLPSTPTMIEPTATLQRPTDTPTVIASPAVESTVTPIPETVSVSDQSIIYSANPEGNFNVFRKNADGTSEPEQLTFGESDKMNFQIAPDGTWGIYYSNQISDTNPQRAYQLWRLDLIHPKDGSIQLTSAIDKNDKVLDQHWYDPTISPDGNTIACKLDKGPINDRGRIYILDTNGENAKELALKDEKEKEITGEMWKPAFCADRKQLFLTVGIKNESHLYVVNIDGTGHAKKLTPDDGFSHWFPTPHPINPNILLYVSNRSGHDEIYMMDLSKDIPHIQLTHGANDSDDPSYSSDGSKITFINSLGGEYNVMTMDADGSNVKTITQTPFRELSPVFN